MDILLLEYIGISGKWIFDPFILNMNSMDDNKLLKDDLVDIRTNVRNQIEYETASWQNLWCGQLKSHLRLTKTLSYSICYNLFV